MLNEIVIQKSKTPKQYRTEVTMIVDILEVAMDCGVRGAMVSAIARRANLSHYGAVDKCQKLIDARLMKSTKDDRNRLFIITEKGIQFLQEFQRFQNFLQPLNLQY